jgi:hypothetical protein
MLDNIITGIFLLYAKLLKDWGIIMVTLIISMRIFVEFFKHLIKSVWRNIIDSGKMVTDVSEDKSLSDEEISEKIWEIMCSRWKQLFVYPLMLIVIIFCLYKVISICMKCWIEMSIDYSTTILLPWINNIHMIDKYYILPFICLISTVIVECYERYSKKNNIKKGLRSLVIITIMTVIEIIIFCKIEAGKVFILLVLQLCGSVYKIKYDKVVYSVE